MSIKIPDSWGIVRDGRAIEKEFIFASFEQAFDFMIKSKDIIDQLNHHPEWINVYNKILITFTTHDTGGISDLDIQLAMAMDELAKT